MRDFHYYLCHFLTFVMSNQYNRIVICTQDQLTELPKAQQIPRPRPQISDELKRRCCSCRAGEKKGSFNHFCPQSHWGIWDSFQVRLTNLEHHPTSNRLNSGEAQHPPDLSPCLNRQIPHHTSILSPSSFVLYLNVPHHNLSPAGKTVLCVTMS